jgi:4-amino-4-deoxy-L-arabinose transferase-like glycosyltransferase
LPIYPILSLAAGAALNNIRNLPADSSYPRLWSMSLGLAAIIVGSLGVFLVFNLRLALVEISQPIFLIVIALALALTLGMSSLLIARRSEQFIAVFFWGMYISLLLFVGSPHWIWELNEAFAVGPVAHLIKTHVPPDVPVYITFEYERPSLNFYSGRRVLPIDREQLAQDWREQKPLYVVIHNSWLKELTLDPPTICPLPPDLAPADWSLITNAGRCQGNV